MGLAVFIGGVLFALVGIITVIKPIAAIKIETRKKASGYLAIGVVATLVGAVMGGNDLQQAEADLAAAQAAGYQTVEDWKTAEAAKEVERQAAEVAAKAAVEACRSDWSKCKDQTDLINNYSGLVDAKVQCKQIAEGMAKYDTEWPWGIFSQYYPAEKSVETGKITLVESEAKFQNGFGAMQKTQVQCLYDLAGKQVLDVQVK